MFSAEEWQSVGQTLIVGMLLPPLIPALNFLFSWRQKRETPHDSILAGLLAINYLLCVVSIVMIGWAQAIIPHRMWIILGCSFYIFMSYSISEALEAGLARLLSDWCGDNWTKVMQGAAISLSAICLAAEPSTKIVIAGGLTVLAIEAATIRTEVTGWKRRPD